MSERNYLEELKPLFSRYLAEKYTEDDIVPEAKINDIIVDSLSGIELLIDIETHYGINVPNDELVVMNKVSDLIDYLKKNVPEAKLPGPNTTSGSGHADGPDEGNIKDHPNQGSLFED